MAAPLLIPAIASAAGSALSSIFGAFGANRRRREAERRMAALKKKRQQQLDDWKNRELNQSVIDKADSQAALARVRDYNEEALKAVNTNMARKGGTDEAKVAAAQKLNKNYASAVSQIAAQGAQHKSAVNNQYMRLAGDLDKYDQLAINNLTDTSGTQNFITNVANAAGQVASLFTDGGLGKSAKAGSGGIAGTNTVTIDPRMIDDTYQMQF